MVEVFKTDVQEPIQAKKLVTLLRKQIPNSKINFDLTDCDKVLRIEGRKIEAEKVAYLVQDNGFFCEPLE